MGIYHYFFALLIVFKVGIKRFAPFLFALRTFSRPCSFLSSFALTLYHIILAALLLYTILRLHNLSAFLSFYYSATPVVLLTVFAHFFYHISKTLLLHPLVNLHTIPHLTFTHLFLVHNPYFPKAFILQQPSFFYTTNSLPSLHYTLPTPLQKYPTRLSEV